MTDLILSIYGKCHTEQKRTMVSLGGCNHA